MLFAKGARPRRITKSSAVAVSSTEVTIRPGQRCRQDGSRRARRPNSSSPWRKTRLPASCRRPEAAGGGTGRGRPARPSRALARAPRAPAREACRRQVRSGILASSNLRLLDLARRTPPLSEICHSSTSMVCAGDRPNLRFSHENALIMKGLSGPVNRRSFKYFNELGRFQSRELHNHSCAARYSTAQPSDGSLNNLIRLGPRAVLRASVRRHRRAPQPGRARNRQGAPPGWLVSDSQGRGW